MRDWGNGSGRGEVRKFREAGERFPVSGAFGLSESLGIGAPGGDPVADLCGCDRAVLLPICADNFVIHLKNFSITSRNAPNTKSSPKNTIPAIDTATPAIASPFPPFVGSVLV